MVSPILFIIIFLFSVNARRVTGEDVSVSVIGKEEGWAGGVSAKSTAAGTSRYERGGERNMCFTS